MLTKKFIAAILAVGTFTFAPNVEAENLNYYTGTGEYIMSDSETQDFAKDGAKMHATRAAQEKAGVFVASHSKLKNNMLKDEIETFTASIVKIIDEPIFEPVLIQGKDGKTYIKFIATVTVAIDLDDLNTQIYKWQKRDGQERSDLIDQNKHLQEIIDQQTKQIAHLEKLIANANTSKDSANIQNEMKQIDKNALYVQRIDEAWKIYRKKNYTEAVEIFKQAIELKPNDYQGYYGRGIAYIGKNLEIGIFSGVKEFNQSQAMKAVQNFNKAIEINPNLYQAYYYRGWSYYGLKKYDLAANDYTRVIKLKPSASEYCWRGHSYHKLGIYDMALEDYNKAANMEGSYGWYLDSELFEETTGIKYTDFLKYTQKWINYNKAIKKNPNDAESYYHRGECHQALGQIEKARADFAKAKQLGYNG